MVSEAKTETGAGSTGERPTPNPLMDVEVAYATPRRQLIVQVQVPLGTTALQAIEASGIRQQFPQIEVQPVIGVFSRKVPPDHPLSAGDRVEIYRPLIADPKEVRRQKAAKDKASRKTRH